MPQTTSMTIQLPVDTNNRLEALAKVVHITRNDIAARAIAECFLFSCVLCVPWASIKRAGIQ